jgi:SAM-dependent methyltransferase
MSQIEIPKISQKQMLKNAFSYWKFLHNMTPYIEGNVLDYACGNGVITRALSSMSKGSFYAYDINPPSNEPLREKAKILSKKEISKDYFNTITIISALHEDQGIIEQATPYLKQKGNLIVADHDKSHLSFEEFISTLTGSDIEEVKIRGLENVFHDHTKMGLPDCRRIAESYGYETIAEVDHGDLEGYPFYLYVGRKL